MLAAHIPEIDRIGDEIARLSAEVDVAIARLLTLIREFDEQRGWGNGFRSCADWLAWRVGLDSGAARERVRVARALEALPLLARALALGELSYAKVRALTRVATRETEARLLAIGRTVTAAQVERVVRGWRAGDPAADRREAKRRYERRAIHVHHDDTGMVVIHGRLDPESGALFMRALEAAQDALYRRSKQAAGVMLVPPAAPTPPQQRADALALLAETALHQELDPGAPGERYQVVLRIDTPDPAEPDQLGQATLENGVHVSAETSERLSCDANRTVIRHDAEGRIVEVAARTRTVPPAVRRALLHRDQVCRFPGCGLRFVQAHHIRHWAHGGPTTLSNLVLLCRYHHRAVHEYGYQIAREENGALVFRQPDGRPLHDVPQSEVGSLSRYRPSRRLV
jgi:5-methylcytosine-specific restriction endonuclease McrA